jgi:hypothetical protein
VALVAHAIDQLPASSVSRAALQRVLSQIGHTVPAYAGISGHVRYSTATQPQATGDPIGKALVVLHLDAARGRSHMDRFLGQY